MAGFCVNCGTPLVGAFCNKCGAKAISPSAPVQAPAPQVAAPVPPPPVVQPAPIAPQSSGMGKILLWVGGILLVLFLAGVGATVYGYYWAKHKVTNYVSAVTGGSSGPTKVVQSGDSCRLLSTADLQRVLGVTIEKSAEIMQGSDPGCAYYTNPAGVTQLQHLAVEHARKQSAEASKRPAPKGDNPLALLKDANQMEGIVKSLSMTSPPPDGQIFTFTIERNFGPDSWSGMRIMESAVPGFEEVAGVGDRAMMGSFGHAFYILKGDVMIHLDTTLVPDARVRGAEIGKKITSRL
jgi:hypothetical protein